VVALSAHEDVSTVMTMLRAGAVGYVVKGDSTDEILSAIHRTVEGKSSVPERLAAPVASAMLEHIQGLSCPVTEIWRRIGPSETTSSPSR